MRRYLYLGMVIAFVFCLGSSVHAQRPRYPLLDRVAQKLIEKYERASCQELAQRRAKPKPEEGEHAAMKRRLVKMMRNDPQMRTEFINRVAAPIANKMFACGLIP